MRIFECNLSGEIKYDEFKNGREYMSICMSIHTCIHSCMHTYTYIVYIYTTSIYISTHICIHTYIQAHNEKSHGQSLSPPTNAHTHSKRISFALLLLSCRQQKSCTKMRISYTIFHIHLCYISHIILPPVAFHSLPTVDSCQSCTTMVSQQETARAPACENA